MIFIYFSITCYILLCFWLFSGFKKVKKGFPKQSKPTHFFSIIIPFRNEAKQLSTLIKSIEALDYPLSQMEVLFVDDDSTDGFQFPILNFSHQILHLNRISKSPKKEAILKAIPLAKYDWIVTTDADCILPKNWLTDLSEYIESTQKEMVAGPVFFKPTACFLNDFQQNEMLALQAVTVGSFGLGKPFMCNGANFAYTKKLFQNLNGFQGNEDQPSGDDVFLLQKAVAQFPEKVGFLLKSSFVVQTQAAATWKALFEQRVRWAGKSTAYTSVFGKLVALFVFIANLSVLLSLPYLFWGHYELLFLFLIKVLIDVLLANQAAQLYQIQQRKVLLTALVYPFFSTFVAIYSLFGNYTWKGRAF